MATSNNKLQKAEREMINDALEMKITSLQRGQTRAAKPIADAIEGVVNSYRALQARINSGELEL